MTLQLRPVEPSDACFFRSRDQSKFASLFVLIAILLTLSTSFAMAQTRPGVQWSRGGHTDLKQLVLSADGKYMATCGTDGTFKIHRLADGVVTYTGSGPLKQISSVSLSPDATKAVTGGMDATIQIWDLSTGDPIHTIAASDSVAAVAWSPDGTKIAATFGDGTIHVYNASDYSLVSVLSGPDDTILSISFSGDSTKLVSGGGGQIARVWQVSTGVQLQALVGHTNTIETVAFSANNATVCTGSDDETVKVWDAVTGALLATHTTAFGVVNTVSISPDSSIVASGGVDHKLRLWRISDGSLINAVDTTLWLTCSGFSPDGSKIYVAPETGQTLVYSGTTGNPLSPLPVEHSDIVYNAVISPTHDTVATASYDTTTKIYDFNTGVLLKTLQGGNQPVYCVAYSPDGTMIATGSNDFIVRIWNVATGALIRSISTGSSPYSVVWTPSGNILVGGSVGTIKIWRAQDGVSLGTLPNFIGTLNGLSLSPDGSQLVSAGFSNNIYIWRLSDNTLVRTLSGHTSLVTSVQFSADGSKIISGSDDLTSIVWNVADGTQIDVFHLTNNVTAAAIAPDGKTAATADADKHLKIWRISDGTLLQDYTHETGSYALYNAGIFGLNYSQDGRVIMVGRGDAALAQIANPYWTPIATGLTVSPTSVLGTTSATGTVTISGLAPPGGVVVALGSSNSMAAAGPATVTVPVGNTTASFTVNTGAVATDTTVALSATLNGVTQFANLIVQAPTVLGLAVSPTSVRGGQNSTGTVTLTGPAPAGGLTVTLASNNTNAIAPANVKVPAGATSATFPIPTNVVGTQNTATITATLGTSATATLTITPPVITALSTSPANLKGGLPSTGTVTISDPAPTGGILITLSSDTPAVASTVPSVTVLQGATTATFAITTHVVSALTSVTFTASFSGSSQKTVLTVTPPTVTSVTLNPASVKGGLNSTGTVTLSDPAPAAGVVVALSSANTAVAGVPGSVTVASGSTTATFNVTTSPVSADTPVVLTASVGASNATGTLTVQAPVLLSFALNPTNVFSFTSGSGILTLDAPAPNGGMTVTLTSPNPSEASMPATAIVPAGTTSVTFPITTSQVPHYTGLFLSATLNTVTKTAELVITPRLPFDFDGDGHNDLVFQNIQTGQAIAWFMNGLNVLGGSTINLTPPAGWQVVGVGDFDNDGHPDLVLQNQTNGNIVVWYLVGTVVREGSATSIPPGSDYKVVGVADFNNDGHPDLLFQNQNTGQLVVWYMKGTTVIGGAALPTQPYPNYKVVGTGDFNNDGHPDIVMQNSVTNQVVVWYMNGIAYMGGGFTSSVPAAPWQVKGIADYNNDGWPDIVFQNAGTSQVVIWFMSGLTVTGGDVITTQPPSPYRVVGPH